MDVTKAISVYISKILSSTSGIKVLLLDSTTTRTVSSCMTQSDLLLSDVYLTDILSNQNRDSMAHLKCIAILSPTLETISLLEQELILSSTSKRYQSYHLYFTNSLSKTAIETLAQADGNSLVKEVQEFYMDYLPISNCLFSLDYQPPERGLRLWNRNQNEWDDTALQRHLDGLTSLLLSLKKKPVIRFERMSSLAKTLAEELNTRIHNSPSHSSLFSFRRTDPQPLLIILDRRNDPVSPLLTQWTYQAMVHEMLGIKNGRVDLSGAEGIREDMKEIVLSPLSDQFFSSQMYNNFGDLGASIKEYVLEYQSRTASNAKIDTVQDMKRFVEAYPEFKKLGGNVSKHVALVGELSRRIDKESSLEVSEVEQSLASQESHAGDLKNVMSLLENTSIPQDAKLRLAILYALRYQKFGGNQIANIVKKLLEVGVEESRAGLVFVMLNLAGADQRQDDLFANENFFSRGKSALKGLKGVENVYTQHSPHLLETVEQLMKGRLRETSYPFVGSNQGVGQGTGQPNVAGVGGMQKPQDVILFMVGGATYEEARTVALLNSQGPSGPGGGARFLLGGSCIHNSTSFLDLIQDSASRFPASIAKPPPVGTASAPLNLSIGPVQLAVRNGTASSVAEGVGAMSNQLLDPERLGDAADGAKQLATDLFGRLRRGVEGISLQ